MVEISKLMRDKITAYLRLIRAHRPTGFVLLLWPAWIALALGGERSFFMYVVFAVGAFCMRSAGCAINDFWDVEIDRATARTKSRPLAAGEIRRSEALGVAAFLCMSACVLLFALPIKAVYLAPFFAAGVFLYPLAQRFFAFPQAVLAVVFSGGATMGYTTATGDPGVVGWALQLASAFWIFGYDTVYAFQDMDDDKTTGTRSSALTLGILAKPVVRLCYALASVSFVLAGYLADARPLFYLGVLVFAVVCGVAVFAQETKRLSPGQAFSLHAFAGGPLFVCTLACGRFDNLVFF